MSRRELARRNTPATAARPTKRSRTVKKAEREPEFPARIEDATPEQIAQAVFTATVLPGERDESPPRRAKL